MTLLKPDINRIRQRVADHRAYERVAKEIAILNHKYAINAMVDKDLEKWMKTPPNIAQTVYMDLVNNELDKDRALRITTELVLENPLISYEQTLYYLHKMLNIPYPCTAVGKILKIKEEREYFEIEFPEELDPDNYIRLYEDDEHDGHY